MTPGFIIEATPPADVTRGLKLKMPRHSRHSLPQFNATTGHEAS
jgi:hypothetical protein